ncbi:hypothetical protein EPA93_08850 [Ktedonosporobacter rubrisoli]|uniref:Methyltransferase n=1 Tax=Ktedonosporobacter rubrisoli TaxID=2509675 RepID=A0A4V0YYG2_KTERU|nr:methyltransferase [Ktedonosporobacter rubrisoli]QBD76111.1 hypothetical protein EPA93_08850 [Ktedonosporobacter rubrisoli]
MQPSSQDQASPLFPILSRSSFEAPDPLALSLQIGLMVTSAVSAAVQLHLPEYLEQPKTVEELAQETNTHAPSLYLLLRALAGIGIFTELDEKQHIFGHTDRSRLLLPEATANLVRLWGADYQWDSWRDLAHTIKTGKPAMTRSYGDDMTLWSYLDAHPEQRQEFQEGLAANARLVIPAILDAYDFSTVQHFVDIGGGHGALAESVLSRYQQMRATLFDRAQIIEQVQRNKLPKLTPDLTARYAQAAGSFFEEIPAGDCYALKNVLMDWGDEEYLRILRACQKTLEPSGTLLIIEPVLSDETPFTKFFSLQMAMMMHAARHRNLEEHKALLEKAGFTLSRAIPLGLEQMLLECKISRARKDGDL